MNVQDLNTAVPQAKAQAGLLQSVASELSRLSQAARANDGAVMAASERNAWRLQQNICLQDQETDLFPNFSEGAAQWLDLSDPLKHFSTHATRLDLQTNRLTLRTMDCHSILT